MTVYTKRLEEKTLEKHKVSIYPLGPAEGLIMRQVPPETSDQFLELYFESPRSCGEGDCVEEVKSCKCCQNRLVVIVIKDIQGEIIVEVVTPYSNINPATVANSYNSG